MTEKNNPITREFVKARYPKFGEGAQKSARMVSIMETIAASPIDELLWFVFDYGSLLRTSSSPAALTPKTQHLVTIYMRAFYCAVEYAVLDRVRPLTTEEKCRVLRSYVKRKMRSHVRRAETVRRKKMAPYYFVCIHSLIQYDIFFTQTVLDLRYSEFSRYMLDAVIMESAGLGFEPEQTDAYKEYGYYRYAYDAIFPTAKAIAMQDGKEPAAWQKIDTAQLLRSANNERRFKDLEFLDDD